VRVTAPRGSTLAGLWPLVGELVGGDTDVGAMPLQVSVGGVALDGSAVVGVPPLVHGATVVVGATGLEPVSVQATRERVSKPAALARSIPLSKAMDDAITPME
jgi:hypothetical protein